jgi:hypothetical protein
MKRANQLRILTLQVIISLLFLNTQISFAQNLNKWNEGPYVGVSLIFNSIKAGGANYINTESGNIYNYNSDKERSKGIKIGYNKMVTDSIFVGPEFSYSTEKSLDFNDSANGGRVDNIRFKGNYNIGLRAGYAASKEIAYVVGYGRSYQTIETSYVDDLGIDNDIKKNDLYGFYRNVGILFNLGSGYNLELLHQINSINANIHKNFYEGAENDRNPHDITINKVRSTSVTISKFF